MDDVGDGAPVAAPRGGGPGPITPDGRAVAVYAALPPRQEPDIISAAVPAGSSILELGVGAGRITRPLVDLGYRVVAVDGSAEMLAHVECDLRFDRFLSSDGAWLDVRAA
ncbi:MAG: hypothetical protein V7637_2103 [Mycobacteriales bacterium]|jgi:SAM-dependent methyltransferase